MSSSFDIEPYLSWDEGLPRPNWDLIDATAVPEDESHWHPFWTDAARQWLVALRDSLGGYTVNESEHFLLLEPGPTIAGFAEHCRSGIGSRLKGVAEYGGHGKHVVMHFRDADDYYRYVSLHTSEGEQGMSGGMHIRDAYGHVAINGQFRGSAENTLAHEMTHVSLVHLDMPAWIEEGLAQMMEHDLTGRQFLQVDAEMAERHKKHWWRHGLEEFWFGDGFHRMGKVQELSYQLAEILMRLLIEEHRPRWFGLSRDAQRKLVSFLRSARREDGGAEASREHLGCELSDIAAMFLGDAAHSGPQFS